MKDVSIIEKAELKELPFKIIEAIIRYSKEEFKFISIKDGIELDQFLVKKHLVMALSNIFSIKSIPAKFLLNVIKDGITSDDKELNKEIQIFFTLIEEIGQKWDIIKKEMIKKGYIDIL